MRPERESPGGAVPPYLSQIRVLRGHPAGDGLRPGTGSVDDIAPDDERRSLPRFSAENIAANLSLVDDVRTIAEARGATSAQIAPAWPPGAPSPSREPNGAPSSPRTPRLPRSY